MKIFLCSIQFLNELRPRISAALDKAPHLRREKFNKRRGAYSSKYGKLARWRLPYWCDTSTAVVVIGEARELYRWP